MLENIKSDIKRFGVKKLTIFNLIKWYTVDTGFKAVVLYRLSNYLYNKEIIRISQLVKNYNLKKTGAEISQSAQIGKNLFIAHPNGIVIGGKCKLGNNVTLLQQVTLGLAKVDKYENPQIGNNVYLGAGCKVLGGIHIGDNCIVAANAVVTKSFEKNLIIGGIPAKEIGINN